MKNTFSVVRTLSSLMLSVMLLMMGNSLFTTLIALRADIEGYPNEMIGLMTSAFFFGFAIGTLRAGPIINRVGHIRSFAAFGTAWDQVVQTAPTRDPQNPMTCSVPSLWAGYRVHPFDN